MNIDKPDTCHSYNANIGKTPEIKLQTTIDSVMIDACIAPVIQHLWNNNVWTIGSCCGHGGKLGHPSIILGEAEENYSHIRKLIKEKDDRYFELSQWKRVIV